MERRGDHVIDVRSDPRRKGGPHRVRFVEGGDRGTSTCRCSTPGKGDDGTWLCERARELAAAFAGQAQETLTVARALDLYNEHQRAGGSVPGTIALTRMQVRCLLDEAVVLTTLTARRAGELYTALRERVAVATHRQCLRQARLLCGWLVRQGQLKANPFADIEPVGKARAGEDSHAQLSQDEGEALRQAAHADPSEPATVVLLLVLTGRRIGDLLGPKDRNRPPVLVRGLDRGGTVLRGLGKGRKKYKLNLPAEVQDRLRALAAGRDPTEPLFHTTARTVNRRLAALCRAAKVPVVTAHGLRGSVASWCHEAGLPAETIADFLSHSQQVNQRSYATAEAVSAGQQARAWRVLNGGKSAAK